MIALQFASQRFSTSQQLVSSQLWHAVSEKTTTPQLPGGCCATVALSPPSVWDPPVPVLHAASSTEAASKAPGYEKMHWSAMAVFV
jgi:hypothetical protein